MRAARPVEQALRLSTPRPAHHVCRNCRLQQFSTSRPVPASEPFYKRLMTGIFGSKESREADRARDERQQKKVKELGQRQGGALEKKRDRRGREYEVAAIVDPTETQDYVQAVTWDGLEQVGSEQWVRERADRGEQYVGFRPGKRVRLDAAQWRALLHHVVVELLTLQKAKRALEEACWPRVGESETWVHTRQARIQSSVDGSVTMSFAQAEAEATILASIPTRHPEQMTQNAEALSREVEGAVAEGGPADAADGPKGNIPPAWMDMSIQDPALKIMLLKRILQLTAQTPPTPTLNTATTLASIYTHLAAPAAPKKLAHAPALQKLQSRAPNVAVHARRQTPIDAERKVGRWKVIQDELMKRDLPVTGSRHREAKAGISMRGREVRIT
ncbi:hypothetical protein B0A50_01282 [Salinomyces thailandicus]|uniref:Large ribosomal subunit protein mL50 n=1 Tax=Salinomyces thailandicus TaxID=706561 RepID=A0A4U0UC10_9PEZI|nr:hypothetical protein B0A50_01282 [Salinomyces thailandica]